jgi:3-oxoadipate enol-lactonase
MAKPGLDVQIVGRGRNLVLLHSLLSDRTSFEPLATRIANQRRLIMVNLPGFGASAPVGPALSDYANSIAALFDDLALPPETDLLGNGLGGFVALSLAIRNGTRLERMVLVGSAIAFPEAARATFRTLAGKVEQAGMAAVVEVAMRRMFPEEFIAAHRDVVAEREAVFRRIDPKVFASACRALAALDLSGELAQIRNPAHEGRADRDARCRSLPAHPGSRSLRRRDLAVSRPQSGSHRAVMTAPCRPDLCFAGHRSMSSRRGSVLPVKPG